MVRKNDLPAAAKVIAEAKTLAAFLIDLERGKCGGDVDLAIHRVATFGGIEEGALRSLRYRWRELRDIKASLLERLRECYEVVYERQRMRAQIERDIDARISGVQAGSWRDDQHEDTPSEAVRFDRAKSYEKEL